MSVLLESPHDRSVFDGLRSTQALRRFGLAGLWALNSALLFVASVSGHNANGLEAASWCLSGQATQAAPHCAFCYAAIVAALASIAYGVKGLRQIAD